MRIAKMSFMMREERSSKGYEVLQNLYYAGYKAGNYF